MLSTFIYDILTGTLRHLTDAQNNNINDNFYDEIRHIKIVMHGSGHISIDSVYEYFAISLELIDFMD
jgi:hypothetical protein